MVNEGARVGVCSQVKCFLSHRHATLYKDMVMINFFLFLEMEKKTKEEENKQNASLCVAFQQRAVGGCQNIFCPGELSSH